MIDWEDDKAFHNEGMDFPMRSKRVAMTLFGFTSLSKYGYLKTQLIRPPIYNEPVVPYNWCY
jgi:hypothetical protein